MSYKRWYWVIGGNRWRKNKYTYTEALHLSSTMINCTDCVNCSNCTDCESCSECKSCMSCSYCARCDDCIACDYTSDSARCLFCIRCSEDKECIKLYYRSHRYKVTLGDIILVRINNIFYNCDMWQERHAEST